MKDSEATLQQEALGIVGVNLVYGACFLYSEPEIPLESFGRLFRNRLSIYVYPYIDPETLVLTKVKNLKVPNKLSHLYKFLVERKMIRQLDGYNSECLNILSRELLKQISTGNHEWEDAVPEEVAEIIKARGYFHYKE